MTDRELDHITNRYRRSVGGCVHGRPPQTLIDLGKALDEIRELRHQLNTLIEETEG